MTGCNKLIIIFQIKLCRYIFEKKLFPHFSSVFLSTYPIISNSNRGAYCKNVTK